MLVYFIVTMGKIQVGRRLNVSHNLQCLLIIRDILLTRAVVALKQHLHAEQRLVIVTDCRLKFLIFDANVAIKSFDVWNSKLISD